MNNQLFSGVFAAGLIQACETAAFTLDKPGLTDYEPQELAGSAYGTWCLANVMGWQEARKRVSLKDWPYHLAVLKAAGVVIPLQGPSPIRSQGWFGTNSYAELSDLIAREPFRITHLLNVPCRLIATWDDTLWPVGTGVQVVEINFMGEWGVLLEALDTNYFYERSVWLADPDATPTPLRFINEFLRETVPLQEDA